METNLMAKTKVMTSPKDSDLELTLFKANEGITSLFPKLTVYEGILTVKELLANFRVEANSNEINEAEKMQRDVDKPRVKGIAEYVKMGETVFPNLTIFVNELDIEQTLTVGNREMVVATLRSHHDRFISDGQGRYSGNKAVCEQLKKDGLLDELAALESKTFAIKLMVTNTKTVFDAKEIVRTTFSDYHLNLKKPSTSLSLYFDHKTPYGRFMRSLIETTIVGEKPLEEWIALNGTVKHQQLWTLVQFTKFVLKALNKTKGALNADLANEDNYEQTLGNLQAIIPAVFNQLPLSVLENAPATGYKSVHANTLFGKALFAEGLGFVVRSFIDRAILSGKLDLTKFEPLASLPVQDMKHPDWIAARICEKKEGKKGTEINIIKRTDKRIGSHLCEMLDIYPCVDLRA